MTSASVGGHMMGIYDYDRRGRQQHPFAAATIWGAEPSFRHDAVAAQSPVTGASPAVSVMEAEVKFVPSPRVAAEDVEDAPSSDSLGHDNDKALRRLAQNREAARKSRLRKKAYIQALESSRLKLAETEQELTRARRHPGLVHRLSLQGVFVSGSIGDSTNLGRTPPPLPVAADPGQVTVTHPSLGCATGGAAAAFELEYARWVEQQSKLATDTPAADPHLLAAQVDASLAHYDALFRLNSAAARRDAFAVLSGAWRAPAERLFLWIGGFRPSDLLAALAPQLELDEAQGAAVRALQRTARQLEDALAQGFGKLQQTINEALLVTIDIDGGGRFAAAGQQQMAGAVGKLQGLATFVEQADHLRQQTLRNMRKILTPRQAARGLLALADYCQRLRALSDQGSRRKINGGR